MLNIDILG